MGKFKKDALIKKFLPYAKKNAYVDFCPEQIVALKWLYAHKIVPNLEHSRGTSASLIKMWEKILCANFHIIDYQKCGINFGFTYQKEYNLFTAKEINALRKSIIDGQHTLFSDYKYLFSRIFLNNNGLRKIYQKLIL